MVLRLVLLVVGSATAAHLGNNTNNVVQPKIVVPPIVAPPFSQPDLRCATYPGDYLGSTIDCSDICSRICVGLLDCPCNDNGRSIGCWVPKSSAKELCSVIDDCTVISMFDGNPLIALPHYKAWAMLGSLPVVPSSGFVSSVCDKDVTGCFSCVGGSDQCKDDQSHSRAQCFASSYDIRKFDPSRAFCVAGLSSSVCVNGVSDECCQFVERGTCDVVSGTCVAPGQLCDPSIAQELLAMDSADVCKGWVQSVLARAHPSLADTCTCLSHVSNYMETSDRARFDCALIPNTRTLNEMFHSCSTMIPCSLEDRCEGCTTYYLREANLWKDLNSSFTGLSCGHSADRNRCVLVGPGGVLQKFSPCSATVSASSTDWYYLTTPASDSYSVPVEIPAMDTSAAALLSGDFAKEPMDIRKEPLNTTLVAPSPAPWPSPVVWPSPKAVDFTSIEIGAALEHRQYVDGGNDTVNVCILCMGMPDTGRITEWGIYAGREGRLHVQILRAVDTPLAISTNPDVISAFKIVGENVLHVPSMGLHRFPIAEDKQIEVEKGDIIGFYSVSKGIVSWSPGGGKILWRYGTPSHPTPVFPLMDGRKYYSEHLIFVGEGISRTYSIAATGLFTNSSVKLAPSLSPSPSHSVPPSISSSRSVSRSPSNSPYPSSSPTPTAVCLSGPSYFCKSEERRVQCGIRMDRWMQLCKISTSPSYVPSSAPSVSTSPSPQCDRLMKCPPGFYPREIGLGECFVAKSDCLPMPCTSQAQCDEWKSDNVATFPACPYCESGRDWTGLCMKGEAQSPVSISWDDVDVEAKSMMFFEPTYQPTSASFLHSGYALMLNGDFGSVMVEGTHFDAQSITFRAPPEHTVEGVKEAALEMQILHKRRYVDPPNAPELMIVSVFFDADDSSNTFQLARLFHGELPTKNKTISVAEFNLNEIVTNDKPIAWYNGSLTQPPCTEGISWALMMGQNAKLSTFLIDRINGLFKNNPNFAKGRGNNRMQQPLNGRKLLLRSNCGTTGAIACPRSNLPPEDDSGRSGLDSAGDDNGVLFAD